MKTFKTTQREFAKYNDMKCTILGELDSLEYNKEEVRLENGVEIQAFADKLI